MAALSLIFDLLAKDNISPEMKKAGDSAEEAGHKISGLGKLAIGGGIALAAVAIGEKLKHIGEDGVDAFKEVTGRAVGLTRVLGGTTEQTSRLAFAAHETGVNQDVLSKGLGFYAKTLGETGPVVSGITKAQQKLTEVQQKYPGALADTAKGSKALEKAHADLSKAQNKLGVDLVDANGKFKSQQTVLNEVADQFKEMPNGPNKTAEAVRLFGRAGAQLIPLLNKGSEGLREFGKESDRLGLTVSGKDAENLKKYNLAHRSLDASIESVKVNIGRAFIPVLADLATAFAAQGPRVAELAQVVLPPLKAIFKVISDDIAKYLVPALVQAVDIFGRVIDVIKPIATALPPAVLRDLAVAFGILTAAAIAQESITKAYSIAAGIAAAVTGLFTTTTNAETGATERGTLARLAHNISTVAGTVATVATTVATTAYNVVVGLLNGSLIRTTAAKIAGAAATAGLTIATAASTVATVAATVATTALAGVLAVLTSPITLVIAALALLVIGLIEAYKHSETFRNIVNAAFTAVRTAVTAVIDAVVGVLRAQFAAIVSIAKGAVDIVVGLFHGDFGKVKDGVEQALGGVVALMTALPRRILGALGNLGGLLVSAGGDLLRGLANGITGAIGGVIDAAKSAATAAVDAVKGALGIASPSRVFHELGTFTAQGLANGLVGGTGQVRAAAGNLLTAASLPTGGSLTVSSQAGGGFDSLIEEVRLLRAEVRATVDRQVQFARAGAV